MELGPLQPGSPEFNAWVGWLLWIPAVAGGIFGLLGGYLTDLFGRRRVLVWSILLYAFSAVAAGYSTSLPMLLFFRTTTFVGVCVEFVAAVAWLAELFPNPIQREKVIGYTQAFSSIGGLLVAIVNGILGQIAKSLPAITVPSALSGMVGQIGEGHEHEIWRYTLMSGLIPAIPLILIRPFLPESPVWAKKRAEGTLRRPSIAQLFQGGLTRTTIVTTIGFACTLAAAFGAIQQLPQIVTGLAEVKEKQKKLADDAIAAAQAKGITDKAALEKAGRAASAPYAQKLTAEYTKIQEIGGLAGRFVIAMMLVGVAYWGRVLRMFQIPGLIILPLVFWYFLRTENRQFFEINLESIYLGKLPITTMSIGIFLVGFFTVAQLSFWGNYLPHVYPVHLRGTGESFAANIGGRLIGTFAAVLTSIVQALLPIEGSSQLKWASAAALVGGGAYVIGLISGFFLPEPSQIEHHD
jgi:MFS family permease